jgi:hypothetical protein
VQFVPLSGAIVSQIFGFKLLPSFEGEWVHDRIAERLLEWLQFTTMFAGIEGKLVVGQ